ncbi:unnamed protein product [Didymodactylos carnosus]|uniref:Transposase n=1 Tax=Didymodactylos carnosus TaxID=1234261 RepID=A0A8S2DJL8_9BILA|nr:unnamed protein product [Didymodactylos carnosus]CAF3719127.1 unnamed protein product [Didymodactylos carnosus]
MKSNDLQKLVLYKHEKGITPAQIFRDLKGGACSKGITPLVISENGTMNHQRYIDEVLPIPKKYDDKQFGDDWTYQQDGARPHTDKHSMKWCYDNMPAIIDKQRWPPNSPDLNPLDYSVWTEFVQQINWNVVRSKQTLIEELKRCVKKIRPETVLKSCESWTNRLHRLKKINGNYLH